jgi:hypothetical protein
MRTGDLGGLVAVAVLGYILFVELAPERIMQKRKGQRAIDQLGDRIGEDLAWTIRRRSRAAMVIGFAVGLVAMLSADDGVSRDAIWVVGGAATISVLGGLLTGLVTYFLNEPKK